VATASPPPPNSFLQNALSSWASWPQMPAFGQPWPNTLLGFPSIFPAAVSAESPPSPPPSPVQREPPLEGQSESSGAGNGNSSAVDSQQQQQFVGIRVCRPLLVNTSSIRLLPFSPKGSLQSAHLRGGRSPLLCVSPPILPPNFSLFLPIQSVCSATKRSTSTSGPRSNASLKVGWFPIIHIQSPQFISLVEPGCFRLHTFRITGFQRPRAITVNFPNKLLFFLNYQYIDNSQ
jgi:hypothetical protein